MNPPNELNNEKTELNKKIKSEHIFKKLKSNYILQKLFGHLNKKISLEIIKYNKNIKGRIKININDYKEYSEIYSSIKIEIIPANNKYGKFIISRYNFYFD